MSLSFLLRSGGRTMSSILPEFRALLRGEGGAARTFHGVCQNGWKPGGRLLEPMQPMAINAVREMKTKGKLNLRCKDCYFVTRQGRRYVMCKTHPRHKQQAMVKKIEHTWILTHAMQSKKRPW